MEKYTYCNCRKNGNDQVFTDRIISEKDGKFIGFSGQEWDSAEPIPYDEIKHMFYCEKGPNGEAIGNPEFILQELSGDFGEMLKTMKN